MEKALEFLDRVEGKMGGAWCIKGHRITIGMVIKILSLGETVQSFAEDYELNIDEVRGALKEAAELFDSDMIE